MSTDNKLAKAGKASLGKAWGAVSSRVGDVYEGAAKKNPASQTGRNFRDLDRMMAKSPSKPSAMSGIDTATKVMGGGALKKRMEDIDKY